MQSSEAVTAASQAGPKPFYFHTSVHLLRIGRERATTLTELLEAPA